MSAGLAFTEVGQAIFNRLSSKQQAAIINLVETNREQKSATPVQAFDFVASLLTILSSSKLSQGEKTILVREVYGTLSSWEENSFPDTLDVDSAVLFIYNVHYGEYRIEVKRTGCCRWLPFCSSCSCWYSQSKGTGGLNAEPAVVENSVTKKDSK